MLTSRIIPTILSKNGHLVKGERFNTDRVIGNALQAARVHAMRAVDELLILDVTATKEGREPDYEMVRYLADGCFAPITVGGGIKTVDHVRELLKSGADKICIGYDSVSSLRDTNLYDLTKHFGSQCIAVSIDMDDRKKYDKIKLAVWRSTFMEGVGVGEILLQSIDRDGTMEGYDLDLIRSVSEAVSIPVVASGGCSGYEDMYNAIQAGASAVAAGALFAFTDCTPKGAAEYLAGKEIEVRI